MQSYGLSAVKNIFFIYLFIYHETIPSRKKKSKWVSQRLVCQKRELLQDSLPVKFQDVKFKDPIFIPRASNKSKPD